MFGPWCCYRATDAAILLVQLVRHRAQTNSTASTPTIQQLCHFCWSGPPAARVLPWQILSHPHRTAPHRTTPHTSRRARAATRFLPSRAPHLGWPMVQLRIPMTPSSTCPPLCHTRVSPILPPVAVACYRLLSRPWSLAREEPPQGDRLPSASGPMAGSLAGARRRETRPVRSLTLAPWLPLILGLVRSRGVVALFTFPLQRCSCEPSTWEERVCGWQRPGQPQPARIHCESINNHLPTQPVPARWIMELAQGSRDLVI